VDEGRKRVLLIDASVLAARKLLQFEGGKRLPATVSARIFEEEPPSSGARLEVKPVKWKFTLKTRSPKGQSFSFASY